MLEDRVILQSSSSLFLVWSINQLKLKDDKRQVFVKKVSRYNVPDYIGQYMYDLHLHIYIVNITLTIVSRIEFWFMVQFRIWHRSWMEGRAEVRVCSLWLEDMTADSGHWQLLDLSFHSDNCLNILFHEMPLVRVRRVTAVWATWCRHL